MRNAVCVLKRLTVGLIFVVERDLFLVLFHTDLVSILGSSCVVLNPSRIISEILLAASCLFLKTAKCYQDLFESSTIHFDDTCFVS